MTLEIETNRGIAAQILRHRSFTFQEFSQRYADTKLLSGDIPIPQLRRQDTKNRQNSTDDLDEYLKDTLEAEIQEHFIKAQQLYNRLLNQGVAKECARSVLPLSTQTRLFMNGTIRSFIHYLDLRTDNGTQLEHRQIAGEIKRIFCKQFPIIGEAVFTKD